MAAFHEIPRSLREGEVAYLEAGERHKGSLSLYDYKHRYDLRVSLILGHGSLLRHGIEELAEEGLRGVFTEDRIQAMEAQADLERAEGRNAEKLLEVVSRAHSFKGRFQTFLSQLGLISWDLATGKVVPGKRFVAFPI